MAFSSEVRRYHRASRTATYGFLSAMPLIVLYEIMIVTANQGRMAQVRVGAEVWMKQLLSYVGGTGLAVMGAIILIVGAVILYLERRKSIPLRAKYFGWIVAESAVYAVVVGIFVSVMIGAVFMAAAPPGVGLWTKLALSIGSGIYEELLFRVILVGGLFWLLKRVVSPRHHAYLLAAVIGAAIFSAVHYIGVYGDPFTLASFSFRFLFGLILNGIFLWRGFGVAAWTHALYDVMVVTGIL